MIYIKRIFLMLTAFLVLSTLPAFANGFDYGHSVRVGVIDSGVDIEKIPIASGYNFLENNQDVTDNKGHGTKIAEIILKHVPKAELVALKCTEKDVNNDNSAIIKAIYEGVDKFGCDVLNISIGMPDSEELKKAIDYACSKGVIIVSAVGNDGEISYKKGKIYYPAGYRNVVGVGAVDEEGNAMEYSQKNDSVFVTTKSLEGTSFSAAEISAAAVIAKQFDRRITPNLFMNILKECVTDKGLEGFDTSYGYGTFDFDNFLKNLTDRYSLLVTDENNGVATICNLAENPVNAKLISTGLETKEILLNQNESIKIETKNTSKCFIWQKSIYDIIWIKRGEL